MDHPTPGPPARHRLIRPRRIQRARAQRRQPSLAGAGRTGAADLGARAGVGRLWGLAWKRWRAVSRISPEGTFLCFGKNPGHLRLAVNQEDWPKADGLVWIELQGEQTIVFSK